MQSLINAISLGSSYYNILLGVIILLAIVFRLLGFKNKHKSINFKYKEMPTLKPIPIETKGKDLISAVRIWLGERRQWSLEEDWIFEMEGRAYIIPSGFTFDGATIPRSLTVWFAPTGILLLGALVHDYLYFKGSIYKFGANEWVKTSPFSRKKVDQIFRDICIDVNGFYSLNYIAYIMVRMTGWFYWNQYKKKSHD